MAQPTAAVPVIRKLDEAVVNKIAAGEVIQRPASALKELLENSLDAGATQITVVVKEGGCKLLQITDNGHGIRKADLPILCHRHTTSKLKAFSDLETIHTLGFRGEALCSISFVSTMTVTSMTSNALHGWRVSYKDSEAVPPGPKAVASVQGTTISVEDLFYNVPTRRKALRSAAEEYARVVDVISRYAVFRTGVAFCCKRHGESRADVSTLAASSRLDNIRAVYGPAVAKELMPITVKMGQELLEDLDVDAPCTFTLEGYVSSANYAAKSSTFILFVNERCVECPPLRKALEATYAAVLPKAGRPFMMIDLRLPPRHVEVNMHPTKREVGMLNQDEVIEAVRCALESLLTSSNNARTFTQQGLPLLAPTIQQGPIQSQLSGPLTEVQNRAAPALERGGSSGASAGAVAYRPQKLVRVDGRAQSMEGFLSSQYATPRAAALAGSVGRKRGAGGEGRPAPPDMTPDPLAVIDMTQGEADGQGQGTRGPGPPLGVATQLDSIRDLAAEVEAQAHEGLCDLIRNHTLVGMADDTLALVQHQTKLYLVNIQNLSHDLFYQQVLVRWERCSPIALQPAPRVHDLMALALDLEEAAGRWKDVPGCSKESVCDLATELMIQNRPMLAEYLAIQVNEQGCLVSLPQLLAGHTPDLGYLPDLMLALGREVDWDEEQACFRGLAEVLAQFYSLKAPQMPTHAAQALTILETATTDQPAPQPAQPVLLAPTQSLMLQSTEDVVMLDDTNVLDTDMDSVGAAGPGAPISSGNGQPQGAPMQPGPPVSMRYGSAGTMAQGSTGAMQPGGGGLVGVLLPGAPSGMDLDDGMMETLVSKVDDGPEGLAKVVDGQGLNAPDAHLPSDQRQLQGADQGLVGDVQADELQQEPWKVSSDELAARSWMIKQVLFPAFKAALRPGKHRATDGTFVLVTSLEKLYRIFERC